MDNMFDEIIAHLRQMLNEAIERADFDLTNPAVLAASVELDRITNEQMSITRRHA